MTLSASLGRSAQRNPNKAARVIAFAVWATQQDGVPSVPQIVQRFKADRDTAARWRRWYAGVTGQTLPPSRRGRPRNA